MKVFMPALHGPGVSARKTPVEPLSPSPRFHEAQRRLTGLPGSYLLHPTTTFDRPPKKGVRPTVQIVSDDIFRTVPVVASGAPVNVSAGGDNGAIARPFESLAACR
jgi:hypothetical protein